MESMIWRVTSTLSLVLTPGPQREVYYHPHFADDKLRFREVELISQNCRTRCRI